MSKPKTPTNKPTVSTPARKSGTFSRDSGDGVFSNVRKMEKIEMVQPRRSSDTSGGGSKDKK